MRLQRYFDNTIARDLLGLVKGEKLGKGSFREVFRYGLDESKVIKFETRAYHFQNVIEFETWEAVKGGPLEKWFAPVHFISPSGTVLIQAYAEDLPDEMLPERVPTILNDAVARNWGLYEGRPVCRDYGMLPKLVSKRMRKRPGGLITT